MKTYILKAVMSDTGDLQITQDGDMDRFTVMGVLKYTSDIMSSDMLTHSLAEAKEESQRKIEITPTMQVKKNDEKS